MSYEDAFARLRWIHKQAMESPIDSPQRRTWIEIARDIEALIRRMTMAATTVTQDNQ
jgi:hypothetical protein